MNIFTGLTVLTHNEEGKRTVQGPTLFFAPHCGCVLLNNIIWANWGHSLNHIVLLSNPIRIFAERFSDPSSSDRKVNTESEGSESYACVVRVTRGCGSEGSESYGGEGGGVLNERVLAPFTSPGVFNDLSLQYFVLSEQVMYACTPQALELSPLSISI